MKKRTSEFITPSPSLEGYGEPFRNSELKPGQHRKEFSFFRKSANVFWLTRVGCSGNCSSPDTDTQHCLKIFLLFWFCCRGFPPFTRQPMTGVPLLFCARRAPDIWEEKSEYFTNISGCNLLFCRGKKIFHGFFPNWFIIFFRQIF
jgi:hypothetical protein